MKIKIALFLSLLVALLFIFLSEKVSFFDEKKAVYIAVAGPMSGENKPKGQAMINSLQLYIDQQNARGGVQGRTLKLLTFDDQNQAPLAKEKALDVVQSQAMIVLGHRSSAASIAAGGVYKAHAMPAITGTATAPEVTQDNDYFFRVVFDNDLQGKFIANYVNKILKHQTASLVYDTDAYGITLGRAFEQHANALGMKVVHSLGYNAPSQTVATIVETLKTGDDPGIIFLALDDTAAAKLLQQLRDQGLSYPVIGGEALGKKSFTDYFEKIDSPKEYTDGVYTTSSLIFDVAGEKAQKFRSEFQKRYGFDPDAANAAYYDAIAIAVEAIKNVENLSLARTQIRNYLAGKNIVQKAFSGVTGTIYFDNQGNAVKSVPIGVYKQQKLISAPFQLSFVSQLPINFAEALEAGRLIRLGEQYMYKTSVVYTGVDIQEISNIDVDNQTYTLAMLLWFRHQGEIDSQDIIFLNAINPVIHKSLVVEKSHSDGVIYRAYQVKGQFKMNFLSKRNTIDQYVLGISFRHNDKKRDHLIYVTDTIGMSLQANHSFKELLKQKQIISPAYNWGIDQAWLFQNSVKKSNFGDPDYLGEEGLTFSRFNVGIRFKENTFTIRGIIPTYLQFVLLVLSALMTFLLAILLTKISHHLKIFWFFQVLFAFLLLLSAEGLLINQLTDQVDDHYIVLIVTGFDVLWWLVPAILLNIAIERFIWVPLEIRTNRVIPTLIRRLSIYLVYTLAILGIIAFVFDMTITSLLATSGVLAMVLGLAIQFNLSNIFSGVVLNIEGPFQIGDWVKIGEYDEGKIINITWRAVHLLTRHKTVLTIPNTLVSEKPISNYAYPDKNYISWFTLHVDPKHPPEKVQKIVKDALLATEYVLKDPPPEAHYYGVTNWSSDFLVWFSVCDYQLKHYHKDAIWKAVWNHLHRVGIEPTVERKDVHLFQGIKARGEIATQPQTLLQELPIFQSLSEQSVIELSERLTQRLLSQGDILVTKREIHNALFIVIEGVINLSYPLTDDNLIEISRLGAGATFGEITILNAEAWKITATAKTDCILYELSKEDIDPFIKTDPDMMAYFKERAKQQDIAFEKKVSTSQTKSVANQNTTRQFWHKIL